MRTVDRNMILVAVIVAIRGEAIPPEYFEADPPTKEEIQKASSFLKNVHLLRSS